MSAEIETHQRPAGALAVSDGQTEWTPAQRAALEQIGVGDAPIGDQLVLLHQAQRTGLDPFTKQIYMIGRKTKESEKVGNAWVDKYVTKWTIQTGIDGYRVIARRIADRLGETLGYDDTQWCGADGVWRDVWLNQEPPAAAKVAVIRNGERFSAVARFASYAQTKRNGDLNQQWATMGDVMIAKCAEALALRRAYPQDLAGIYTAEEMGQADNPPVDVTATATVHSSTPAGPGEAERAEWLAWAHEEIARAADRETLGNLWRVIGEAVQQRLCTPVNGDSLRGQITERVKIMDAATTPAIDINPDTGEIIPDEVVAP
ncbi:phage recombination protein Bet [Frankia sp. Cj3]|uniref:phage recombination protein Bet n=1 Tax=Frankia sp. Cj3 TaxID=2880976 RepID=UPI001EF5024E|nr:phage recombination protein Bet [Frankia sp. Cj3]